MKPSETGSETTEPPEPQQIHCPETIGLLSLPRSQVCRWPFGGFCRWSQQSVSPSLLGLTFRVGLGCCGRITAALGAGGPGGLSAAGAVGLLAAGWGAEGHPSSGAGKRPWQLGVALLASGHLNNVTRHSREVGVGARRIRSGLQQLADLLDRLAEAEPFAGAVVEFLRDPVEVGGAVHGQVAALGEVLPQSAVGVFVGATLPG